MFSERLWLTLFCVFIAIRKSNTDISTMVEIPFRIVPSAIDLAAIDGKISWIPNGAMAPPYKNI